MILEGAAAALALAPIAFAGGFIQGLTGFGSALVTIPLATFFVPLPFALAVFAVVDFVNGLRLGLENPRNAVLAEVARMVPLMIVGVATGATLLVNLPRGAGGDPDDHEWHHPRHFREDRVARIFQAQPKPVDEIDDREHRQRERQRNEERGERNRDERRAESGQSLDKPAGESDRRQGER